jgi:hypothetical protein
MQFLPLTPDQLQLLQIIRIVTSSLSLIGELVLLMSFFYYNRSDGNISLKMIISLVAANLIFTISNFIEFDYIPDVLCAVESFLRNFSIIGIIAWTCAIAYISYIHTLRNKRDHKELYLRVSIYIYSASIVFAFG